MSIEPLRLEEVLDGQGNLFENDVDLGEVNYKLHIFRKLPNLLNPNEQLLEGEIEVQGHIYLGDIDDVFEKNLTLKLNDGRLLSVKLSGSGTIIEAKFIKDSIQ